jgi:hypothetical protein
MVEKCSGRGVGFVHRDPAGVMKGDDGCERGEGVFGNFLRRGKGEGTGWTERGNGRDGREVRGGGEEGESGQGFELGEGMEGVMVG